MNVVEAASRVVRVTVYNATAQVHRVAKVALPPPAADASPAANAGDELQVVFKDLPADLDRQSLQISVAATKDNSHAGITLRGIVFDKHYKPIGHNDVGHSDEIAKLSKTLESLTDRIADLRDEVDTQQRKAQFVKDSFAKVCAATEEDPKMITDTAAWGKLLAHRKAVVEEASAARLALTANLNQLTAEKQATQANLTALLSAEAKSEVGDTEVVKVLLLRGNVGGSTSVESTLQISYMVRAASWAPQYDIRVHPTDNAMAVAYNGVVSQATREEWTDVVLELSTARPSVSGDQPELSPWRIRVAPKLRARGMTKSARKSKNSLCREEQNACLEEFDDFGSEDEEPMAVEEATVEEGATSFLFTVPGTHTVPSNNKPVRVSLTQIPIKNVEFSYVTVPRKEESAYLLAEAVNTGKFALLAGEAATFSGNRYIATSHFPRVAVNERFKVQLGVDNGVPVKFKRLRSVQSAEGNVLSGKKERRDIGYHTKVKNTKDAPITVKLIDHVPVSDDGSMTVEVLAPKFPKDLSKPWTKDGVQWSLDESGSVLSIVRTLKPREEWEVPLQFRVEYPKHSHVYGL